VSSSLGCPFVVLQGLVKAREHDEGCGINDY
jgi:hypothetical protein